MNSILRHRYVPVIGLALFALTSTAAGQELPDGLKVVKPLVLVSAQGSGSIDAASLEILLPDGDVLVVTVRTHDGGDDDRTAFVPLNDGVTLKDILWNTMTSAAAGAIAGRIAGARSTSRDSTSSGNGSSGGAGGGMPPGPPGGGM